MKAGGFQGNGKRSPYDPTDRKNRWATPPALVRAVEELLDIRFDLDAGAEEKTAKAPAYFGPDHEDPSRKDAFTADWGLYQTVWCNPPYRYMAEWLELCRTKGMELTPVYHTVVVLGFARTDVAWWHDLVMPHAYVILLRGRVPFLDPDTGKPPINPKTGKPQDSPPAGSFLAIYSRVPQFATARGLVDGWDWK
jgi:phage N-6-adenine-methyltransferase